MHINQKHTHTDAYIKDKINDIKQSHKYADYVLTHCSLETNTRHVCNHNKTHFDARTNSKTGIKSHIFEQYLR